MSEVMAMDDMTIVENPDFFTDYNPDDIDSINIGAFLQHQQQWTVPTAS